MALPIVSLTIPAMRKILPFTLLLTAALAARASSAANLEDLDWLVGDWRQTGETSTAQETWLAPMAGSMPGVFRLVNDGRLVVHEYILIAQEADRVVLRFKHYNADYSTWEGDGPPLTFKLAEASPGYAMWENVSPTAEAPDLLRYQRTGDRLTVTVMDDEANPGAGDAMTFEFRQHADLSGD